MIQVCAGNEYTSAASAVRIRRRAGRDERRNSVARLTRVSRLLADASGRLDVDGAAEILRDREGAPDAICAARGESPAEFQTVSSTIAEIAKRRVWIALGPPHLASYHPYEV